jgi:hypothetical protein
MREFGDGDAEVWDTEIGWNDIPFGYTQEQDARNVCEVFTTAKASEVLPEGRYDKTCWWVFFRPAAWNCWGLVNFDFTRQQAYYAFKQTEQQIAGKRLNGRVMTGVPATDALVRMYEFEDPASAKKTWVCWKNGGGRSEGVSVKLPVRTGRVAAESLDYAGSAPTFSAPVADDG